MTISRTAKTNTINAEAVGKRRATTGFLLGAALKIASVASIAGLANCASPESSSTSITSVVAAGEQLVSNAEYDKGYGVLDAVADSDPSSMTAALSLADAYYRQGAYMKAESFYTRAIQLKAEVGGKLGLARIELARSNPGTARAYLQEVLALEPNNLDVLNGLAVAYDLMGQHDLAQEGYQNVLALDPANQKAHNNLALSQALSGNAHAALPRIAELLRSNLNNRTIRQNLALVEYLSNNRDAAMRVAMTDLTETDARVNFRSLALSFRESPLSKSTRITYSK
ncbi:Flp pilus assembly protein TadD [Bradyrhizobium sp. USDA 4524]|uniref:tetratricopeptide repeat protein n=1 Tax=unclassified Bradyrhizobium TaxID=2631580 RepID=UPI00209E1137|nr:MULTISPECIES: tetratricopeptide repeat protein [unclassified Bradyrhizobium]MCP1846084.1 Flp pilus assembly protein TadD [Bradyrhizobium sp. USDA 4538]MCP1907282.1 Flp pilus assembly protein TadD [Bradyrhizobium sp. USDA 4537]MCP1985757.1 Flp pilus assembly protein TadD [Bradyrhizobium sp. USDA 4539]